MSIHQIAILLQIIGVLFTAFFGSILLEPEVAGKLARWLISRPAWVSMKLDEAVIKIGPLAKVLAPQLSTGLTYSFFWLASVVCLILGWVLEVPILFWVGVALFCYYVLVAVAALATMAMELARQRIPKGRLILRLLVAAILLFVIGWFIWSSLALILIFVSIGLSIGFAVTGILARPKTLKNSFLIFGGLILLSGLILELIVTYQ